MPSQLSFSKKIRLMKMIAENKKTSVISKKLRISTSTINKHKSNNSLSLITTPKKPVGRTAVLKEKHLNKLKNSARKNTKSSSNNIR